MSNGKRPLFRRCQLITLALVMYDIRQKEEGVQSWKEHTGTFINPVVFRIAWLLLGWFARLRQVQFPWGRADLQNQLFCTILRRKYNTQKNYSFYYVLDTWVISQGCMRSRWLDIGLVLFFLRVYGPRRAILTSGLVINPYV